jgi:long-chain acyl-CoA synthetase
VQRFQEEIESHYCRSPFVKEICVLGRHAVVVPDMELMRRRKIVNVGDLLRFELEGLSHLLPADTCILSHEIWFDPLPRSASQQVERDEVERRVRELRAAREAPLPAADRAWLQDRRVAAVVSLIQARAKGRVAPDANLEIDLGLDSMERVELLAELEHRFGVTISSPCEIFTVRQLAAAVRSGPPSQRAPAALVASADRTVWEGTLRQLPDMPHLLRKRTCVAPLLWALLRIVRPMFVRARVGGLDRLPRSGPFIIAPNHQSYVDPFILCSVLPYRVFTDVFFVGAPEYFETAFTRWVARTANLVAVDPDSNLVPAMQASALGLGHGKILLLFPEGERSIDGTVRKFKKGAAILAQHLGVPVVPVALKGIHEVWPRSRGINWRLVAPWSGHRVSIEIGEPLSLPSTANYTDSAARLRARVSEMWEALSA